MYRINSLASTLLTFHVVKEGVQECVALLPRKYTFSEEVTDQLECLEKTKRIRITEDKSQKVVRHLGQAKVMPCPAEDAAPIMRPKLEEDAERRFGDSVAKLPKRAAGRRTVVDEGEVTRVRPGEGKDGPYMPVQPPAKSNLGGKGTKKGTTVNPKNNKN
jgi:hypothetical protein